VVIVVAVASALLAVGLASAWLILRPEHPGGKLETQPTGVTVTQAKPPPPAPKPRPRPRPKPKPKPAVQVDQPCWLNFGGDPQRSLARTDIHLGVPTKLLWVRRLHGYAEYPPSYCDGTLYVNTFKGKTFAIDAATGKVLWARQGGGPKPSTPAIAGPRLIVSSTDGTVTGYARDDGRLLWRISTNAKVESSPVAMGNTAYFGATDGRLFAVDTRTGKIRWAYNTGGRINSSPSIWGKRICITTYAGSIFCLNRFSGHKLWDHYVSRDFVRDESFYASASTDGRRLFTISRTGKVVALLATNGRTLWTHDLNSYGYSTPAVANGRVFVGDFNGQLHAYNAATGSEIWRRYVGGRILGPAFVIGKLVFFSTLEQDTYAVRFDNGRVVWHLPMGKYSPGIATDEHYYFTLNGFLLAYTGRYTPKQSATTEAAGGGASRRATAAKRRSR
jgi:eukaryotic-like serine/threonine-protein kinase